MREFIEKKRHQPMDWHGNDCLTGLAIPIARMASGNENLFASYMVDFGTIEGAIRAFKGWGFDSLGDLLASELREISPEECQAGDIIAAPLKGTFKHTLGVFDGEDYLVYAPFGLVKVDPCTVERAFTARGI